MTNERARELAKKILAHAWGDGSAHYRISEAEVVILAYRDEVRREALKEVAARIEYCIAVERGAQAKGALRDAGEYIAAMGGGASGPGASSPANTGGPTPERIQNVDRILREGRAVNATRTDHDWIGAALLMLTRHFPAISDRDRAFWADVKREWPDVG